MESCDRLKGLQAAKGVSQAKLAADIHISRSAVAKRENGLGLPNDESLRLLSEYFDISIKELLPDKPTAETIVTKNRTIDQQRKAIIGLFFGCGIGLFILAFIFIEPLRDCLGLLGLGIILTLLGIFNMKGNIATIHWYNRRKVKKEDQLPYCRCMGLGMLIIGLSLIAAGFVQALTHDEAAAWVIASGVLAGLTLMLYAQFKYNKGIF